MRRQKYYTYTPSLPKRPFKFHSVKKSALSHAILQTRRGKPTTVWKTVTGKEVMKGMKPELLWQPVQLAISATAAFSVMGIAKGAMEMIPR